MGYEESGLHAVGAATAVERTGLPGRCRSRARQRLGMQQLDACGLSETWLQKTCGDRHWQALARLYGRAPQHWSDDAGRRVYAAFGYLRLTGARLSQATEGRMLTIDSETHAIGRAQAWSRHRVSCVGNAIGCLDLVSVFVGRSDGVSNRSVQRVDLGAVEAPAPMAAESIQARAKALRAEALRLRPCGDAPVAHFAPCPRGDYNGAGLLYFASFTALVDRAMWQMGRLSMHDMVLERECAFVGNLDLGQSLCVSLIEERVDGDVRRLSVRLTAASDERTLALMRLHVARHPVQ